MFWTITCFNQSLTIIARDAFVLAKMHVSELPADFCVERAGAIDLAITLRSSTPEEGKRISDILNTAVLRSHSIAFPPQRQNYLFKEESKTGEYFKQFISELELPILETEGVLISMQSKLICTQSSLINLLKKSVSALVILGKRTCSSKG